MRPVRRVAELGALVVSMHTFFTVIVVIALFFTVILIEESRFKWVFNRVMLLGAGLGLFVGSAVSFLVTTADHKGPGIVQTGGPAPDTGGIDSDISFEKVPESVYKRHNYAGGAILLILWLMFWLSAAAALRDKNAKAAAREAYLDAQVRRAAAQEAYLEAQLRRAGAFSRAFASTLDEDICKRATAKALSSEEFRHAQKAEEVALNNFCAASNPKGGDYL